MNIFDEILRARGMAESITDGMSADQVRAIETDHAALLERIGAEENRRLSHLGAEADRYRALPAGTRLDTYMRDMATRDSGTLIDTRIGSHGHANDNRAEAIGEALFARLRPAHQLSQQARQFAGLSVPEIARTLLAERQSVQGLSASEVVVRSLGGLHSAGDFSLALQDFTRRVLADGYTAPASGIKQIASQSTAKDFRAKSTVKLSGFSAIEKVNEHGEFKRGTFEEGSESYRIFTYGKIFSITRQSLVNDDLSAFAKTAQRMGQSSLEFEAQSLADLLMSNPTMEDGTALFHASHKNLGTAAALSVDSLSAARLAMRHQTGLAGELISVTPSYLLVPAQLETQAEKVLAEIAASKTSDVNPFAGKLELVVEPRLKSATGWYVAASPNQETGIEYSYLEGAPGPQIDSRVGFDVDGMETRVRLDFGAGVLSHVPLYYNPGQ